MIMNDKIQDINNQMARITEVARAYANATPEQRANVSLSDMQAMINRYNQLKEQRTRLYTEQETRVQNELNALAQANAPAPQINTRGTWRKIPQPQPQPQQPQPVVNIWNNKYPTWPLTLSWWQDTGNMYNGPINIPRRTTWPLNVPVSNNKIYNAPASMQWVPGAIQITPEWTYVTNSAGVVQQYNPILPWGYL